jgi:stage II sporulation protein D
MWTPALGRTRRTPPHNPRHRRLLLFFGLLGLIGFLPTPVASVPIRVLLFQNLATFPLSIPPSYTLQSYPDRDMTVLATANGWRSLVLRAGPTHVQMPGLGLEVEELRVLPRDQAGVIDVGGRLFRGGLAIKRRDRGLMVVNILDLEEYLYGVVPKEAPPQWEMAALRAQAIVARTYTLYKRQRQTHGDYDVAAEYVRDQAYDGYGAEHPRTTQAVDETRGLVLTCQGELIPTYYHAESAGYTENSEHVWSAPHPCLRAVKTSTHPASPYIQWSATLSLQDLRATLGKKGYVVGHIQRIEPIQRSPTGRIILLRLGHTRGETVLRGTDFRLAVGPEIIRSTRFTVDLRGGRALFSGQGWGHGVGLCQWCSQGMAELGYDYEAILKHYYLGATLTRQY